MTSSLGGGKVNAVSFAPLPPEAAWQHRGARSGFEVVFFCGRTGGCLIRGCMTAVEDGMPWAVEYAIRLDSAGATRSARVSGRSSAGSCSIVLEGNGKGRWLFDGERAPLLDGCLDVDLESSAMTNALPARRLGLAVDRLEQTYLRTPGAAAHQCYDYTAPAVGFECRPTYDQSAWCSTTRASLSGPTDRRPGDLADPHGADARADHPARCGRLALAQR